jgi:hypothetical protein
MNKPPVPKTTMRDNASRFTKVIDLYTWKHSWHLPRDRWGNIDWKAPECRDEVESVLNEYRAGAEALIREIDALFAIKWPEDRWLAFLRWEDQQWEAESAAEAARGDDPEVE